MPKVTDLRVGFRVELLEDAERFPHFVIPKGARGTVTELNDWNPVYLKMDEPVPGCELWDNCLLLHKGLDDDFKFAIVGTEATGELPVEEPEVGDCQICGASEMEKKELWVVGYMDPNSSERTPFWSCIMAAPKDMDLPQVIAKAKAVLRADDEDIKTRDEEWEVGDYDDPDLEWFAEHVMRPIIV